MLTLNMKKIIQTRTSDPFNFYLNDKIFIPHGINRFTIYFKGHNKDNIPPNEYLQKMHNAEINSLRIIIPGEFERALEYEPGQYHEEYLKPIDDLFDVADKLGIYIILCLFDSSLFVAPHMENAWQYGVYSTLSPTYEGFLDNPTLIDYEKRRVNLLVNHFNKYNNLFAWEVINELNYMGKYLKDKNEEVAVRWFEDIANHIKSIDQNHLITFSLWVGAIWYSLFSSSYNDFVEIHTYDEIDDDEKIGSNIKKYINIGHKFNKPTIIGE